MKKHVLFKIFASLMVWPALITAQNFSWENGDKLPNQAGSYSNPGVSSPGNEPSGRRDAASWSDSLGNLWLFGGDKSFVSSSVMYLNDLLKYDITTGQWTLLKGAGYSFNSPGIYGTQGIPDNVNAPGSRRGAATWVDKSGNLWLFGGHGYGASSSTYNYLNDLWKYNPATNMWSWMKGSDTPYGAATYGTKGVFAAANTPGARRGSVTAVDASGKLWLYGGQGRNANGSVFGLNDLWCYDIALSQWAWISGNNTNTSFGVYLTKGTPNPLCYPSGRFEGGAWADKSGNIWLFGGFGWTNMYDVGSKELNDVWRYEISTGLWTWMHGSDDSGEPAVYGTMGSPAAANTAGGKYRFAYATDPAGNFWIYGGGQAGNSTNQVSQTLWKYDPVTNTWTWIKGNQAPTYGMYGTMHVPAATNLPGRRFYAAGYCDPAGNFWIFGGEGYGESTSGFLNDLWKFENCTPGTFKINSSKDLLCAGETVTLSVNTNFPPVWNTNETSQSIVVTPTATTTYSLALNNVFGCNFSAAYMQTVSTCNGINGTNLLEAEAMLFPNPSRGNFMVRTNGNGPFRLKVFDTLGKLVFDKRIDQMGSEINCGLTTGIYYYEIDQQNATVKGKLIIH